MTGATQPLISARDVTISFDGVDVVKSVSLDLNPGEIHAMSGENGAGKSSIAKVFAGVYQPRKGTLLSHGKNLKFDNPRQALSHGVALIHQEPLIFPDLDVAENIFVGHHPKKGGAIDWKAVYSRASDLLQALGVDLNPKTRVGSLSVAKQQMVELACALSHDAKVWIFDETTAPLTPKEVEEIFVIMRRLRDQGCALAMVTHHMDEIWQVADRISVLRDGVKVGETSPQSSTQQEVVRLMVGRDLECAPKPSSLQTEREEVVRLEKFTGRGFRNINLHVGKGEIVGISGLVGAGRTELAQAIFGLTKPTSGEFQYFGKKISIGSPREAIRQGIALVPEDRQSDGLIGSLSISFNATLAHLKSLSPYSWIKDKKLNKVSEELTSRLNLVCRSQDQPTSELSGGNQQKVVLSKWLMTQPRFLILDEPTRGVDVGAKQEVHNLIRAQVSQGLGVLLISSDLPEILSVCDRVLVMREGTVVAELRGAEATEEKIMLAATGQEVKIGA